MLKIRVAAAALALSLAQSEPVAAYPVDCAILLCLAAGWPASAECAQAKAVFIARITPCPVEPPLQIWNCPMRAASRHEAAPLERLFEIVAEGNRGMELAPKRLPQGLALTADQAGIDISDPACDFVRSIRVFQIEFLQRRDCKDNRERTSTVMRGGYGRQGDYSWVRGDANGVPEASAFDPPRGCGNYWFRCVFVDWRDFQGGYGFEEVRY